jgi:hypothetical protein
MKATLLSISLLFNVGFGYAQALSDSIIFSRGDDSKLAPRIGIGTGFFTYFGDVQDNNFSHPFTSSWGYEFRASANFSRHFDLDLSVVYGDITINERSPESIRNRNFRSEIFVGGVGISYNFNHLYKKKPGIVQPYVGVGVAFIHFDSKTDLLDANGNTYHYWSDGTIMDRPENSETAWQAVELQRDYEYETDLRQMNNDGLGKYGLFTFSVPVSAGLDFKMGRRISARLGASFHYTFTDLMDDFTHRGNGERKGNSANDMFLFTSLSVAYAFGVERKQKAPQNDYFEGMDVLAMDVNDADADGVRDIDDLCAMTPDGVEVDEFGCPLDTDRDLIADYRDKEEFTGAEKIANLQGIGLTDQMIWEQYLDSMAVDRSKISIIFPSGVMSRKGSPSEEAKPFVAQSAADSGKEVKPVVATPIESKGTTKATEQGRKAAQTSNEMKSTAPEVVPVAISQSEVNQLNEMMTTIANDAGKKTPSGMVVDEFVKEVFNADPDVAANVEDVAEVAERVYVRMVKEGKVDGKSGFDVVKSASTNTAIPQEYALADFNGDGIFTSDEILRAIEELIDGKSPYAVSQILGLVNFYQTKMADARVVDFGGTMAVYIDGKLNILPNFKNDGLTAQQRFLVRKYPDVDYNGDGQLTPDEVNRAIKEHQQGNSRYSDDYINSLIDMFFED